MSVMINLLKEDNQQKNTNFEFHVYGINDERLQLTFDSSTCSIFKKRNE